MSFAFIVDKIESGGPLMLTDGPDMRVSPFFTYAATSPTLKHDFAFYTLEEAERLGKTAPDGILFLYAVGLFQFFHRSWWNGLHTKNPTLKRLQVMLERLTKIPNCRLVLDFSWETASPNHLEGIPKLAQALGFPIERIIFLSNNPLTPLLSTAPLRYGFTAIGSWFFEYYIHHLHCSKFSYARAMLVQKRASIGKWSFDGEKLFLSLNRRVRLQRLLLAAYLQRMGYIEFGFFSFGGTDANPEDNYLRESIVERAKALCVEPGWERVLDGSDVDAVGEHEPYELDVQFKDLQQDSIQFNQLALGTSAALMRCYEASWFSIVSETDFGTSVRDNLLTEKIFKPIVFGHPFIILSGPGALRELRTLGYETFAPWIDDEYDDCPDISERFLRITTAIRETIIRLRRSPEQFLGPLLEVAQYNQDNFISGAPKRFSDFLGKLESELTKHKHLAADRHILQRQTSEEGRRIFRASENGLVDFDTGFSEFEPRFRGRWCSDAGTAIFWIGSGTWRLTLFTNITRREGVPIIRRSGMDIEYEFAYSDDRGVITIVLQAVEQFVTLSFTSRSVFVPAEQGEKSSDWRVLGFWLHDEFQIIRMQ